MYSQILQLFLRRFVYKNDQYKERESKEWCRSNAISEKEAINRVFPDQIFESITKAYPDEISHASSVVNSSPFEMGGAGALDLVYNIAKHSEATLVLETGVSYGWSSLAFLLAINEIRGVLYSIDMPYPKMGNEKFVGRVVPERLRKNWKLLRVPDRIGIPRAIKQEKGGFDIVHYDSDKSYSGRKWAYPLLWDSLKIGGYFISDDIQDNVGFKEFCNDLGKIPIIVESQGKHVGILAK